MAGAPGPDGPGLIPARGETTVSVRRCWHGRWAHPRSRGDDKTDHDRLLTQHGSSPLAGRRPPRERDRLGVRGLIPARGETTPGGPRRVFSFGAHPRSRGDDSGMSGSGGESVGSSPLAGRRRVRHLLRPPVGGLIPARGETTSSAHPWCPTVQAHPRSRGDDSHVRCVTRFEPGSSPLAGRRPAVSAPVLVLLGLIPARGETTATKARILNVNRAHPRSRGDDIESVSTTGGTIGSSPLAGRRLRGARVHPPRRRLIPARGETTRCRARASRSCGAHPRSRGDDFVHDTTMFEPDGSSPLAGRRRSRVRPRGASPGLIPARGETTWWIPPRSVTGRAHPRSRGDDFWVKICAVCESGSSPLAGRRRHRFRTGGARAGLIPARGETTRRSTGLPAAWPAHPRSRGDDP